MSFSPIFQYKLGFCEKVGFRNPGGGMVTVCEVIQILLDMDPRGVWASKKAKKSWDAKQSPSAPVLTGHIFAGNFMSQTEGL